MFRLGLQGCPVGVFDQVTIESSLFIGVFFQSEEVGLPLYEKERFFVGFILKQYISRGVIYLLLIDLEPEPAYLNWHSIFQGVKALFLPENQAFNGAGNSRTREDVV